MYTYILRPPDAVDAVADTLNAIGDTVGEVDFANTIKEACFHERAFFFGFEKGFFILLPRVDAVLVWAAASFLPVDRAAVQAGIEGLVREINVPCVEFWSVRPGFDRVARALGYSGCEAAWMGTPITVWRKSL